MQTQPQGHAPCCGQSHNGYPGRAGAGELAGKNPRQAAIQGEHQRQTRIRHDQRIRHAQAAQHPAHAHSQRESAAAHDVTHGHPRPGGPAARIDPRMCGPGHGHEIGQGHQANRDEDGQWIVALRTVHLTRHSGGIVPAREIPHGDQQSPQEIAASRGRANGAGCAGPSEGKNGHDHERSQKQHGHEFGRPAHHTRTAQVERGTGHQYRDTHHQAQASLGCRRPQSSQIEQEQRGVNGHVKDAGAEGKPGFLKTPERSHGPLDPHVVAALVRYGAGQLAHHEGRGQTPHERRHHKQQQSHPVAHILHQFFQTIRPTRDHEVSRSHQPGECEFPLHRVCSS